METQKERHHIPASALVEWKETCSADRCSPENRDALIHGAYISWRKYFAIDRKWREEISVKGKKYVYWFSSAARDMFEENKTTSHPFHAIEEAVYRRKEYQGKPLKNWMFDHASEKKSPHGWLIKYLFEALLWEGFIQGQAFKKKENKWLAPPVVVESDESLDQGDDFDEKDHHVAQLAGASAPEQGTSIDSEYLRKEVKKIWDAASEKQKAACYYIFKSKDAFLKSKDRCRSKNDPYDKYEQEYKLSDLEIKQIVGVSKTTFNDAPQKIVIQLGERLKELGFEATDAIYAYRTLLSQLVYDWAQNSDICKAMDEAVAQKNAKQIKTYPEITGTSRS